MLTLYKPGYDDLWFRQRMLADEETMSYNHAWGGTVDFPREDWKSWYDHWIGNPEGRRFYRYVMHGDCFVGEAAYHYDGESGRCLADVIILAALRRSASICARLSLESCVVGHQPAVCDVGELAQVDRIRYVVIHQTVACAPVSGIDPSLPEPHSLEPIHLGYVL